MTEIPRFSLAAVVFDCPDARDLANFYSRLLGWDVAGNEPDWVMLRCPTGGTGLSFQSEEWYRTPVWPEKSGELQKMMHLDIQVDDLEAAGEHALQVGATLAEYQPQPNVRVYLDPAGHPFCLFVD